MELGSRKGSSFFPETVLGTGAYTDLFYLRSSRQNWIDFPIDFPSAFPTQFSNAPYFLDFNHNGIRDAGEPGLGRPTWDTWPLDFERNGFSEDLDGLNDEGLNGIDDNSILGVDDLTERETRPPYSVKLRGIEIRIRVMDPGTRQVRQQTVRADFTN